MTGALARIGDQLGAPNDYDDAGFRRCNVTGLDVHRSVESFVKPFGLTAVVALVVGGTFAFTVAMTRWELVGLLEPADYYTTSVSTPGTF